MNNQNQMRDFGVLVLGLLLVIGCIALARIDPKTYATAALQMRVLTALGGGLIGTTVPGLVGLDVRGVRAAGAAGFVVLFFLMAPVALGPEGSGKDSDASSGSTAANPSVPAVAPAPPPPVQPAPVPAAPPAGNFNNSPVQVGGGTQQVTYDQHTENN